MAPKDCDAMRCDVAVIGRAENKWRRDRRGERVSLCLRRNSGGVIAREVQN